MPDELGEFGLGKRKRAEVTYKEELSDGAWTRMIEAGLDPQQEVEKRKKEGLPLDWSDMPKEQQASDRFVSENEYDDELSNDDFVVGKSRKRNRS